MAAECVLEAVGERAECRPVCESCQACALLPNAFTANPVTIGVAVLAVGAKHPAAGRVMQMFGHLVPRGTSAAATRPASGGAGSELKAMLGWLGFDVTPRCNCEKHAATMDENGVEWCEQNVSMIVGWLKYEASARQLTFSKAAATVLVNLAIARARAKRKRMAARNGM